MEEKKAYCFVGEPQIGKSTTIRKILEGDLFRIDIKKPKIQKDFVLSFPYEDSLIGICSIGDNLSLLKKWLMPLKEKGCKIFIFACHPTKKVLKYLKSEFSNFNDIECNVIKDRNNEEEWKSEHSRRIDEFKRVFQ